MSQMDLELLRVLHQERLARAEHARKIDSLSPELTYRPGIGSSVRGWLSRHTPRPRSQGWESL